MSKIQHYQIKLFKSGLLNQLFLAMLVIMVLSTVIIGTTSYMLSSNTYKNEIEHARTNALEQTARSMDSVIRGIEETFINSSLQTKFADEIRGIERNGFKNINPVISELQSLRNVSRYIFSVYLYLAKDNRVLTAADGIWKADEFYDQEWIGQLPAEENIRWLPTRLSRDNTGTVESVITFIIKLPQAAGDGERYLAANLSENDIASAIRNVKPASGETTAIVNRDNRIICGVDPEQMGSNYQSLFGDGYNVFIVPSAYNNWHYINAIPSGYNAYPVIQTALIVLAAAAIWMVFGFFLSRKLSTGIYKPYHEVIRELKQGIGELPEGVDEADLLQKSIRAIIDQNNNLFRRMTGNEQAVRTNFVRDLILYAFIDEPDMEAQCHNVGFNPAHKRYSIVIAALDHVASFNSRFSYKDRNLWMFSIENITNETIGYGENVMSAKIGEDSIVFIVPDRDELPDLVADAKRRISELLDLSVTYVISKSFEGLYNAGTVYEKCLSLLQYRMLSGSSILHERDLSGETPDNHEPLISSSKRELLLNQLRQGNLPGVNVFIDRLIKSIHDRQLVDPTHIHMAIYGILGEAQSVMLENGWQLNDVFGADRVLYRELAGKETIEEIGQWLKEVISQMGPCLSEKKETKNRSVMGTVVAYINEHFSEDIRLNSLADAVYFSPAYLSRLFRQETGKNFVEYVTEIRIEKSCELLQNPDLRIADIAQIANFGTVNNFLRVFKKYKSMTPGQYRSMLAVEKMTNTPDGIDEDDQT